jgi:hypothetical protein
LLQKYLGERHENDNLRQFFARHNDTELREFLAGQAATAEPRDPSPGRVPHGLEV